MRVLHEADVIIPLLDWVYCSPHFNYYNNISPHQDLGKETSFTLQTFHQPSQF